MKRKQICPNMIAYIFIAALFRTLDTFIDKILTQKGISRFDYFFYMCMTMLPFSAATMLFETPKFSLEPLPVLLLLSAAVLRYWQLYAVVGIVRRTEPYQYQTFLTLGIVFTYIIDCFIGSRLFTLQNVFSIALILSGILMIGCLKMQFSELNKDVLLRVFSGIAQGYITFYILKYWSNTVYIFTLNFILSAVFIKKYNSLAHPNRVEMIKWAFLQQSFGFFSIYLTNKLMEQSVSFGIYVVPASIIIAFLFSFIKKYQKDCINTKKLLGVIIITLGILLLK